MALKLGKCRLCLKLGLGDFYSIFTEDNCLQLAEMVMECTRVKVRNALITVFHNFLDVVKISIKHGSRTQVRLENYQDLSLNQRTGLLSECVLDTLETIDGSIGVALDASDVGVQCLIRYLHIFSSHLLFWGVNRAKGLQNLESFEITRLLAHY